MKTLWRSVIVVLIGAAAGLPDFAAAASAGREVELSQVQRLPGR